MGREINFHIEVTMNERWINDFCSMLKYMQHCGEIGHSTLVAFFSDGDGDFRPRFEIHYPYEQTEGYHRDNMMEVRKPEIIFDAG